MIKWLIFAGLVALAVAFCAPRIISDAKEYRDWKRQCVPTGDIYFSHGGGARPVLKCPPRIKKSK